RPARTQIHRSALTPQGRIRHPAGLYPCPSDSKETAAPPSLPGRATRPTPALRPSQSSDAASETLPAPRQSGSSRRNSLHPHHSLSLNSVILSGAAGGQVFFVNARCGVEGPWQDHSETQLDVGAATLAAGIFLTPSS